MDENIVCEHIIGWVFRGKLGIVHSDKNVGLPAAQQFPHPEKIVPCAWPYHSQRGKRRLPSIYRCSSYAPNLIRP